MSSPQTPETPGFQNEATPAAPEATPPAAQPTAPGPNEADLFRQDPAPEPPTQEPQDPFEMDREVLSLLRGEAPPEPEPETPPATPTPAEETPPTEPTQPQAQTQPPVAPAETPPESPVAPAVSPEMAQLQQLVQSQAGQIAQLTQAIQGQVQQQVQPAADPKPQYPAYDYSGLLAQVPDLVDNLTHEDRSVRATALAQLASGISGVVHERISRERDVSRAEFVGQQVQTQTQNMGSNQSIYNDFYGKFPHLNNPALQPLVMHAAGEVQRESGATAWTPQLADSIGARVAQYVELGRGAAAPQVQPPLAPTLQAPAVQAAVTTVPQNGASQPPMFGGGARPAAPGSGYNEAADVRNTLFGGR